SSGSARRNPGRTARRPAAPDSRGWSAAPCRRPAAPLPSPSAPLAEVQTLAVLGLFADVEGADRTVITHHPRPDFAALTLLLRKNLAVLHGVAPLACGKRTQAQQARCFCSNASSHFGQNSCSPSR